MRLNNTSGGGKCPTECYVFGGCRNNRTAELGCRKQPYNRPRIVLVRLCSVGSCRGSRDSRFVVARAPSYNTPTEIARLLFVSVNYVVTLCAGTRAPNRRARGGGVAVFGAQICASARARLTQPFRVHRRRRRRRRRRTSIVRRPFGVSDTFNNATRRVR